MAAGGYLVESFGQGNVWLVGGDRETHVGKLVELRPHRRDHGRMAVAGVHHPNAACEIDQAVTIGISDHRALGAHHGDRCDGRNAARHCLGAPSQQGAAFRAGNLGHELDDARHLHPEKICWSRMRKPLLDLVEHTPTGEVGNPRNCLPAMGLLRSARTRSSRSSCCITMRAQNLAKSRK